MVPWIVAGSLGVSLVAVAALFAALRWCGAAIDRMVSRMIEQDREFASMAKQSVHEAVRVRTPEVELSQIRLEQDRVALDAEQRRLSQQEQLRSSARREMRFSGMPEESNEADIA